MLQVRPAESGEPVGFHDQSGWLLNWQDYPYYPSHQQARNSRLDMGSEPFTLLFVQLAGNVRKLMHIKVGFPIFYHVRPASDFWGILGCFRKMRCFDNSDQKFRDYRKVLKLQYHQRMEQPTGPTFWWWNWKGILKILTPSMWDIIYIYLNFKPQCPPIQGARTMICATWCTVCVSVWDDLDLGSIHLEAQCTCHALCEGHFEFAVSFDNVWLRRLIPWS